ncbi:hypothetical protein [Hoylesella timonensis]|uniref:hypothetical protein n=1 Tax=Hoylesella timonensis TaxID=386414 RepID=UPI001E4DDE64|nr:hypothetical protein [Hoylesella timonensis]
METNKIMNKILLTFILLTALSGCKPKPFKGFLVCKEYIQGHMDNVSVEPIQEAYVSVHVAVPRIHTHKYIPSEWIFYVANKDCVLRFNVDSLTYIKHRVGERIVMNN